jgi:Protein of unknown function (DUF3551)
MRTILLVTVVMSGLSVVTTEANAQYYPWCATYSTKGGSESCSFVSFGQCRLSVSGVGGFCYQNPWAFAAAGPRVLERPYRGRRYYR